MYTADQIEESGTDISNCLAEEFEVSISRYSRSTASATSPTKEITQTTANKNIETKQREAKEIARAHLKSILSDPKIMYLISENSNPPVQVRKIYNSNVHTTSETIGLDISLSREDMRKLLIEQLPLYKKLNAEYVEQMSQAHLQLDKLKTQDQKISQLYENAGKPVINIMQLDLLEKKHYLREQEIYLDTNLSESEMKKALSIHLEELSDKIL